MKLERDERFWNVLYTIKISDPRSCSMEKLSHTFGYVHWKCLHPHESWFGTSATISSMDTEILSLNNFIPVQRIAHRCAFANIKTTFTTHTETVLVTCPIPLKFSV